MARDSRGRERRPLARHAAKPGDADWVLGPATGRKACLRANGNKIEKTIYGHALIDGAPGTFIFRSTAYRVGRDHSSLAFQTKATIDGEEIRVVGAKWRVTSRLESNNLGRWFVPQIDLIGRFGSPSGPTLAEARAAKALRIALKTGGEPPPWRRTSRSLRYHRSSTVFTTGKSASIERPPNYDERVYDERVYDERGPPIEDDIQF